MGIAGVGKTVSVNKLILDWAEGKENQDIDFILPLPFRELNLITNDCSLMGLLHKYVFNGTEELPSLPQGDGKVLFIFDGLDECRFRLIFKEGDIITDVHKITTVSKIVTSLIKRHLLPSALIWITSRPAAASLIPRDYIDQVTEVRGFNDEQKEQYFNKNSRPFQQLEKGNLIFYKEDIEECGLDVSEVSVFSGLCTQIFQEEKAVSARSVFSFVHLSVQEFLAALYVFLIGKDEKADLFLQSRKEKLKAAVNKALQSENGHLDLFLRFLLGLSLESNQSDLKELLPRLELNTENVKDTVDYIKKTIEEEESVEKTINLFHCLSELKDNFVEEIQKILSSGNLSAHNLSSAQWSGLVFVLLMSEEAQEKFELQKYRRSNEALIRLLPVIKNTRTAL
ncbi:hypothetical protein PO909_029602 [Leuciscus waleckii]